MSPGSSTPGRTGGDIAHAELVIGALHEPLFECGRAPPGSREGTVMQPVKPWLAETARRPGARLIWASTAGLAVLALATFYVSFRAQYAFMYAVKHQDVPALIEALIADVAMVVCSLLALGMACAGQSAKVARLLVVIFAGLSAGMNYLAADVSSFRSGGGVRDAAGGVRGVHRPDGGGDPPARPGHR